tara:strand:- start:796 stop:1041 length:246 start_codon:yes stop_codon:yes gene_type:complete
MDTTSKTIELIAITCSLDVNKIEVHTNLKKMNVDSLDIVEVIMELEEEFKIEIADENMTDMFQVSEIIRQVEIGIGAKVKC